MGFGGFMFKKEGEKHGGQGGSSDGCGTKILFL